MDVCVEMILLMVQKSSDHQLRLVVYLPLFTMDFIELYIPGGCWGISAINCITKSSRKKTCHHIGPPLEVFDPFLFAQLPLWKVRDRIQRLLEEMSGIISTTEKDV